MRIKIDSTHYIQLRLSDYEFIFRKTFRIVLFERKIIKNVTSK